jgi:hypothetical protein
MSELEDLKRLLIKKLNKVKSEEEAKKLMIELKPQMQKLTELFNEKYESDSYGYEGDIDWISELSEYIINTIKLYLHYHVKGELKNICITLSEQNSPDIMLTIDKHNYIVDFDEFKDGTNKNNRDAHRECYYQNESVWSEYRSNSNCFDIPTVGEEICNKLKGVFPTISIDYIIT